MVGDQFHVDDGSFEQGALDVSEFFPVYDVGVEVAAAASDHSLNVAHRFGGVPTVVKVNHQGAQSQLVGHVQGKGAVYPSADTQHAIVKLSPARLANFRSQRFQPAF